MRNITVKVIPNGTKFKVTVYTTRNDMTTSKKEFIREGYFEADKLFSRISRTRKEMVNAGQIKDYRVEMVEC